MPNKSDQSMVRLPLEAQFLSRPVVAMEVLPHAYRIVPQQGRSGDGGHRRIVMKKSGGRAVTARSHFSKSAPQSTRRGICLSPRSIRIV